MRLLDVVATGDALLVFAFIGQNNVYPDAFFDRDAVVRLIQRWRGPVAAD
jgi:hypothetical protein